MCVAKMVSSLEGDFSLEECQKKQMMSFDIGTLSTGVDVVSLAARAIF